MTNKEKTIAERIVAVQDRTGWECILYWPCPANDVKTFVESYKEYHKGEYFFAEEQEALGDKFNENQQFLKLTNNGEIIFEDGYAFWMQDFGMITKSMRKCSDGSAIVDGKAYDKEPDWM